MPLLFAAALPAYGQGPTAVRFVAENDGFNFWIPPWRRTDHEYTSGVLGTVEYPGRSQLLPLGPFRRANAEREKRLSNSFTLGQVLYTGEAPRAPGIDPAAHPSFRTNVAWLYVEAGERDSSRSDIDEFRLAVGVVGSPALGGPMQKLFHALGPTYPLPVDWSRQMPFEPGFVATVQRTHLVGTFGDATQVNGDLTARVAVSLGTILTGAVLGGTGTIAVPLGGVPANPWWPTALVSLDAAVHGVMRDESLDGTFFRASEHLEKNWAYDRERLTFQLRWSRMTLSYGATRAGPQYRLQRAPMAWGTLAAEVRFGQ